ncbi:hypothetical protein Tco_1370568 [Tanacetum coccineum]
MSSASSAVTYTSVYTDSEQGRVFWGADEEISDGEDGPVDYPTDGGDDGDDDDGDSSRDGAESAVVIPTVELVSLLEGTKPASISLPPETEVERLLAIPTPPPSPPISLSLPSAEERLARIASTQALVDAVTAALPSPPLPPLPPSLYIPPPVDRRDDIPKRSRVDYRFVSIVDAEVSRQGISEVGYGIKDTWVDPAEAVPEIAPMTVGEVNIRVTELVEFHKHDTQDLYALLEDAQDGRTRISQRVAMDSQQVNYLWRIG